MTVFSTAFRTNWYTTNGVNRDWSYNFALEEGDVSIEVGYNNGTEDVIDVYTSNFTLFPSSAESGFVRFPTTGDPVVAGVQLRIVRVIPHIQPVHIGNQGLFHPEIHERALDRLTMMSQQNRDEVARAVKVIEGEFTQTLPLPVSGRVIGWDNDKLVNVVHSGIDITNATTAAAASAATANSHRVAAQTAKTNAEAARDSAWEAQTAAASFAAQAETAMSTALVDNAIYPNTTAGLAATAEGGYFFTPGATPADPLILYQESGGVAVQRGDYPSSAQLAAALTSAESLAALFPKEEYTIFIANDASIPIVPGGYPFARRVTDDRTLTHLFVEITGGNPDTEITINIRLNNAAVYPSTAVLQGVPLENVIDIDIVEGDTLSLEIEEVVGIVYAVWAQIDGSISL